MLSYAVIIFYRYSISKVTKYVYVLYLRRMAIFKILHHDRKYIYYYDRRCFFYQIRTDRWKHKTIFTRYILQLEGYLSPIVFMLNNRPTLYSVCLNMIILYIFLVLYLCLCNLRFEQNFLAGKDAMYPLAMQHMLSGSDFYFFIYIHT